MADDQGVPLEIRPSQRQRFHNPQSAVGAQQGQGAVAQAARRQQAFKRRKRAQECLRLHARIINLHHHSHTSVPGTT
ncbi:hypothetical protein [Deinococcus humi]|uniref:Uncharacterized protein n=1 Tax=Deinococcus humi TaxID=662880 RepID=A0A7W8NGZ2_9DEIO|nr:hypothetical protein [Deinococcus humi]MBB5365310.1 hypothetical protein [Deinococcus humi]